LERLRFQSFEDELGAFVAARSERVSGIYTQAETVFGRGSLEPQGCYYEPGSYFDGIPVAMVEALWTIVVDGTSFEDFSFTAFEHGRDRSSVREESSQLIGRIVDYSDCSAFP
jgi:hypothetical protein